MAVVLVMSGRCLRRRRQPSDEDGRGAPGFYIGCRDDTGLTSTPSLHGRANLNTFTSIELGVQDTMAHLEEGVMGEGRGVGGIRSDHLYSRALPS